MLAATAIQTPELALGLVSLDEAGAVTQVEHSDIASLRTWGLMPDDGRDSVSPSLMRRWDATPDSCATRNS